MRKDRPGIAKLAAHQESASMKRHDCHCSRSTRGKERAIRAMMVPDDAQGRVMPLRAFITAIGVLAAANCASALSAMLRA